MRNLFMTESIMELGSGLTVKKLRRLFHKRRKVRVFVWKGIRKNIISYCYAGNLLQDG